MIKKRSSVMLVTIGILGMILLIGCGAGTGGDEPTPPAPPPGQTTAASIDLLVSNTQLNSDGATTVTLTAVVKDSANRALSEKEVSFTADSGLLAVTGGGITATTDANGQATAILGTGGSPTNRVINLTAATGSVSAANAVTVAGTTLSISGAASLSFGDSTPLTIFLKNSAGAGIAGKTVTVTSLNGNTLSPATAMTNASGQVTVNITATAGGADKITASAIGATKEFDLTVNTAILTFITPSPVGVTEIPIETNRSVTVEYISGTTPQAGVTINFLTTRGVLSGSSAPTGADGRATVTVSSMNSGPGLLTASVASGPTAQVAVEFVATTVVSLTLQASPATIGTNSGGSETEKSLITAVVRDANNNLVKNKSISFTIVNDVSGGRLTPASAVTDSSGSASTYFIAGASSGGLGGVTIRASVMGTAVSQTTTLTVAKKALFVALATGPTILKIDPNKYQQDYVALVTDSAGNPVAGATVVPTITPLYYTKGYYVWPTGAVRWQQVPTLEPLSSTLPGIPACANEDGITHNPLYDFNGILDPGEDQNGNSRLDPGNVASVTSAVTDSTGHATVSVVYARDYAYWVNVKLEAFANDLKGSTASAFVIFDLPGAGGDYTSPTTAPPGYTSPFGMSASCYVDLMVTPVSTSQMTLTWQKSATANHYHVYRDGINIATNVMINTYFDTGLSHGTLYCYQISTVDAAGTESSFTGTVCNATYVLPPSGLTATAISPSQIRLSWAPLPGATGYRVYQDAGSGLVLIKDVVSTSTVVSGLTANTLYCYAVAGNNLAGDESPKSAQVCATTQLSAPSTPTGLTATGKEYPPTVTLTWNASAGACKYNIYRDGGVLPSLSENAPAVTTVDTGMDITTLKPKTNYCYTISAESCSGNESAQSTQVCTATGGGGPLAPTGLSATVLAGPQVRLNWSASAGAVVYRIYRNGAGVPVLSATGTTATDTTVVNGAVYCYIVVAESSLGNASAPSTAVCIATSSVAPPLPPTSVTATLDEKNPLRIIVTWSTSVGAASYRVYRNGGTIPYLSTSGAQVADSAVAAQTQYCYTVSALDALGNESAQSTPPACESTGAAGPPTPTGLTATPNVLPAPPSVVLTWNASSGAVVYRLYRDGSLIRSLTALTVTDTTVIANRTYCYTIVAENGAGIKSIPSSAVCVSTPGPEPPPVPADLAAIAAAGPVVNLTWTASTGATGYRIYRGGTLVAAPGLVTAWSDSGVSAATTYCYTISAVTGGIESIQSAPSCTVTP